MFQCGRGRSVLSPRRDFQMVNTGWIHEVGSFGALMVHQSVDAAGDALFAGILVTGNRRLGEDSEEAVRNKEVWARPQGRARTRKPVGSQGTVELVYCRIRGRYRPVLTEVGQTVKRCTTELYAKVRPHERQPTQRKAPTRQRRIVRKRKQPCVQPVFSLPGCGRPDRLVSRLGDFQSRHHMYRSCDYTCRSILYSSRSQI